MKLKLGIITKDRTFRNHINNQLISIENIEMIAYKSYEIYDILLIDYDNAKDIYESVICSYHYKKITIIVISKQTLKYHKHFDMSKNHIFIEHDSISTKLVKLLMCITMQDYIVIKSQRIYCNLRYYDILIVYPENHYLNFVLESGTMKSRMSINEISELLISHGFAISNASTYVNLHRIKYISKHEVCLDSDKHTSVSRYKHKALIKKFKEMYN